MRLSWFTPRALLTRLSKILSRSPPSTANLPTTATTTLKLQRARKMELRKAEAYAGWSHAALISRVLELEKSMEEYSKKLAPSPQPIKKKSFNPALYSTRDIALKIAYLGGNYCGFEYHVNCPTPLPTIEEEIFKALLKARLVPCNPGSHEDGGVAAWPGDDVAGYSKCGRTDRGVSAFGQVIGVRVRSNRPLPKTIDDTDVLIKDVEKESVTDAGTASEMILDDGFGMALEDQSSEEEPEPEFDDVKDELPYGQILNRLLPPDIRVLAWCPSTPEGFSARFNCRERRYKYFFTNPPIAPTPASAGILDVAAMQEAARLYVGAHDFRNFCKLDASKQISNFERIIRHASIEEVGPLPPSISGMQRKHPPDSDSDSDRTATDIPKVYAFTLHGSAFLWHQVRHMVAILFLVGQGLEPPSIVKELLDVRKFPRKPLYQMADDRPLVLWDCVFPEGELSWIYAEEHNTPKGPGKEGRDQLVDVVWSMWHKARVDEVLSAGFLDVISSTVAESQRGRGSGDGAKSRSRSRSPPGEFVVTRAAEQIAASVDKPRSQIVVDGGHEPLYRGKYVPVLERKTMEDVEVINKRYAEKKGDWREGRRKRAERNGESL
ncbi:pseudouridine synthase deg1 [Rhizina undulata]